MERGLKVIRDQHVFNWFRISNIIKLEGCSRSTRSLYRCRLWLSFVPASLRNLPTASNSVSPLYFRFQWLGNLINSTLSSWILLVYRIRPEPLSQYVSFTLDITGLKNPNRVSISILFFKVLGINGSKNTKIWLQSLFQIPLFILRYYWLKESDQKIHLNSPISSGLLPA